MNTPAPSRTIAIVGRPNVGKSALFNRLVGRRVAIVHEECGVTRDRIQCEAAWDGAPYTLVDTGGLASVEKARALDAITAGVRAQAEAAIEDAAVILLVVDVQAGLVPLDEEVARFLHRKGRTVYVAANKADHGRHDDATADFQRLGFPVFPVSALHNRGLEALMFEAMKHLPPAENRTVKAPLKVAVIGRPNAGKSSYINRLLNSNRVIVSDVPGTTRDSIEIPFTVGEGEAARHYLLIDTAGVRPGGKVHEAVEKFSRIRVEETIHRADVCVLMMDAAAGPSRQDKHLAAQIVEAARGCVLLVNKWDLRTGDVTEKSYREALRAEMPFLSWAPLLFISARTGAQVRTSIEVLDRVAASVATEFSTGVLNRLLHDAVERKSAPSIKGRRLKLYYATQTGTRPVRLKIFINDPELVVPAYETYLQRMLRERFGLEGAPLRMEWVGRARDRHG